MKILQRLDTRGYTALKSAQDIIRRSIRRIKRDKYSV